MIDKDFYLANIIQLFRIMNKNYFRLFHPKIFIVK